MSGGTAAAKKRRYPRVDMEIPAELTDRTSGVRKLEAAIGNLGPDGAYIRTSRKFEAGARVDVAFKLSSHPLPFEIPAEVRWYREGDSGGIGVQFLECPQYDRAAIDDFCQQRLDESRGLQPGAGQQQQV